MVMMGRIRLGRMRRKKRSEGSWRVNVSNLEALGGSVIVYIRFFG
jgi:hypothetical protein